MNAEQKQNLIAEAEQYWHSDHPVKAGMLIFERIPLERRAAWAANILEFACQGVEPIPEVAAVIRFAREPEQWPRSRSEEAHDLFGAVRSQRLALSSLRCAGDLLLEIAEHTAGITYTSRQYPAPFDHNRGWRIVAQLKSLVEQLNLDERLAWRVVADEQFIQLDRPLGKSYLSASV